MFILALEMIVELYITHYTKQKCIKKVRYFIRKQTNYLKKQDNKVNAAIFRH